MAVMNPPSHTLHQAIFMSGKKFEEIMVNKTVMIPSENAKFRVFKKTSFPVT